MLLEGITSLVNMFAVVGPSGFCVSQFCICVKSISQIVHAGGYLGGVWEKIKKRKRLIAFSANGTFIMLNHKSLLPDTVLGHQ